ncbi:MAG: ATP-dependent metallopeptidase FtsH/Yme1/Tma family protein, partial [Pseudomonadota bacterium]
MGNARNFAFWIVLFLLLLALFRLFSGDSNTGSATTLSYSEFVDAV